MKIQITVNGITYPITRDVCHAHPQVIRDALGTASESELQHALDTMNVADWYDGNHHLGPDVNGLEMFAE
jgi:hypothetical protein